MTLPLNDSDDLRIGGDGATSAWMNGVQVWPPTACPRYLGTLPSSSNGIGIIDDTTFIAFNNDEGRIAWYLVPSSPQTPFTEDFSRLAAGNNPAGQIGVRDTGEIFHFDYDTPSFPEFNLWRTPGITGTPTIITTPDHITTGLSWNPYDDKLYDFRFDLGDWHLRQIDPDTGTETLVYGPFPGDGPESDVPSFTPDGGVWFYSDFFPSRYDIAADTFETFYSVEPRDFSGTPVPAVGTPGAAPGDVFIELDDGAGGGIPARLSADGSVSTDVTCEPFATAAGNETARVGSTKVGGAWLTIFLWPTSGGFGDDVWLIDGRP